MGLNSTRLRGIPQGQRLIRGSGTMEKMCCYDLHSHSTASDGALTPAGLVEKAHSAGVDVLALTDHDTVDGLMEAAHKVSELDVSLVPGVEISVTWQGMTIHVLGLNVDFRNQTLVKGLRELQDIRSRRARDIDRRLADQGIADALQGASRFRKGETLTRTHFAQFLVASGYAGSLRDVFKRYLVRGKPGYVHTEWAPMERALGWIRQAGGLAVIAHPARYRLTRSKLRRLVVEFREAGGLGLEVVSGSHSRDETLHMAAIAREHRLFASCGSDYHGPEKPWVELGRLRKLPDGCTPIWEAESWPAALAS